MMDFRDEWGHDPSVQAMRRIFSQLEKAQEALLKDLKIPPFDLRLRGGREHARDLFVGLWPVAGKQGIVVTEEDAVLLYVHCFSHALRQRGIVVPGNALEKSGKIVQFLKEKLS